MKEKWYVILNKPKGYVSAMKDNLSPTIVSLIKEKIKGLHIVGRLDKDTTGIIVLTNDGPYTHNATHPKKHVNKTYHVSLGGAINDSDIRQIESGMHINHGKTKLKPAEIKVVSEKEVLLTISEGKFHQVKKMFVALNNKVINLHRASFDGIDLDKLNLNEGEYIILSEEEFLKKKNNF